MCRYLAAIQPLSEPVGSGGTAAVVGAEVAAELLVQRFALPGSLGIPEMLSAFKSNSAHPQAADQQVYKRLASPNILKVVLVYRDTEKASGWTMLRPYSGT